MTRIARVRNIDVRKAVRQEEVMTKRKQRAWKEKVEEMEDDRLVKQVRTGEIVGERPRGKHVDRQFLAPLKIILYSRYHTISSYF